MNNGEKLIEAWKLLSSCSAPDDDCSLAFRLSFHQVMVNLHFLASVCKSGLDKESELSESGRIDTINN